MPIYANVKSYLSKHHRAFLELLERVGIDTDNTNTVIVPTEAQIKKWTTDIDKYSKTEFADLSTKLYAHTFRQNFNDPKVLGAAGFETINGARQLCKVGKISGKEFELMTGADLKTIAKCKIDPNFEPSQNFKDSNQKPICVVVFLSGEIATDGQVKEFSPRGAAEDPIENEVFSTFYGAREDLEKIRKAKCDNFKYLLSKGRQAFAECIGGLLKYLDKTELSELDSCKQVVASLLSYDACATYVVIIQPYGDNSFIPSRLMLDEWNFTHALAPNYVTIFEEFAAKYAPKIDESARSNALKKARSQLVNVNMSLSFKEIYDEYVPKVYPSDFGLSSSELLWAHEAEFKMIHSVDIIDLLAEQFRGADYEKESAYSNEDYIRSCSSYGIFSSESLRRDNSPNGFAKSEYFLKYTLVADPACCKTELESFSNPLDAKAKAFCLING